MPYNDKDKARESCRISQSKRYYRIRELIKNEPKKECECNCGRLINTRTPEGRINHFAHGHRKLTPEESLHRKNVLARLSSKEEFQKRRFSGLYIRPNKVERRLMNIIKERNLPFKYVGDGSFLIGKCCPDFISTDESNRVIEVFGDYWHTIKNRTEMTSEEGRVNGFKKLGYDCLVLWYSKIKHLSDEKIYNIIINWNSVS